MYQTFRFDRAHLLAILMCLVLSISFSKSVAAEEYSEHKSRTPIVVTLWWVIFNYPENCSDNSCGANDMVDAADVADDKKVKASVVYGTGQITDKDGRLTLVSALYPTNIDLGSAGATAFKNERLLKPFGPGLLNVEGANIHLVMRSHGPVIDEHVDKQLTTVVDPGCRAKQGPNDCKYIYGAVHPPGQENANVIVFGKPGQIIEGASSRLLREENGLKAIIRTKISLDG